MWQGISRQLTRVVTGRPDAFGTGSYGSRQDGPRWRNKKKPPVLRLGVGASQRL